MSESFPSKESLQTQLTELIAKGDLRTLRILWKAAIKFNLLPNTPPEAKETTESQIFRLVYTSARSSVCTEDQIDKILESARRNNPMIGITGILIYSDKRFLQVIEGSIKNTRILYDKIQKDPRHVGSNLRFFEPVKQRLFADWNMAHKSLEDLSLKFKASENAENGKLYRSLIDGDLHNYHDDGIRIIKAFLSVN